MSQTNVVEFQDCDDKPISEGGKMEKLLSDLRHQGWKIRPKSVSDNMIIYKGNFLDAEIFFTNLGIVSSYKYQTEIEAAAVDFAVQQIRRIK